MIGKITKTLSVVAASVLITTVSGLASTSVNIKEKTLDLDSKVISFVENKIAENSGPGVTIDNVLIKEKIKVDEAPGFTGYVVTIDLTLTDPKTKKDFPQQVTDGYLVSKEGLIATQMFDFDGKSLTDQVVPTIDAKTYYNKKDLLYGSGSAENKLLLFSDPMCPYCRDMFPELLNKMSDKYDVYLIDFPLERIHPSSKLLLACSKQARRVSGNSYIKELYTDERFKKLTRESNMDKTIKSFVDITGYKIDKKSLLETDMKEVEADMAKAFALGIKGTPSLYLNGKKHNSMNF